LKDKIQRLIPPGSLFYFLSGLILTLTLSTTTPLLPLLRDSFFVTAQQISYMGVLSGVGMVIVDWPVGYLVQRFGARRMLVSGLLLIASGPALSATAMSFPQLLVGAMLTGMGFAVLLTTNIGGLSGLADDNNIGATMGTLNGSMLVGGLIGPLLSGTLAELVNWRTSYVVVGSIAGLVFLLALIRYGSIAQIGGRRQAMMGDARASLPVNDRIGHVLRSGLARPLLIVFFFYFVAIFSTSGVINYLFPLIGKDQVGFSVQTLGGLLSMLRLITVAVVIPIGILADRTDPRFMLILGFIIFMAAELTMILVPTASGFTVGAILLGWAGTNTSLTYTLFGVISRKLALENSLGPFRLFGDLGAVAGPLAMGLLVEKLSYQAGLVGAIGMAALTLVFLGVNIQHHRLRDFSPKVLETQ
jgi:predicted MFS family arabinose efflux permease